MLSQEGDCIITSTIFIVENLMIILDVSSESTVLIDYVGRIVENLIEFIRNFNISIYLLLWIDEELVEGLTMFKFEMKFFGVFAYDCDVCELMGWEE